MDQTRICSITLEPIINGGMTCFGSIYEYDAISNWLKKHDIDPLTGEECPTKFVRKINIDKTDLEEISKDARATTSLVFPATKTWRNVKNIYLKYLDVKNNKLINILKEDFDQYSQNKREIFIHQPNQAYHNLCSHLKKTSSDIYFDEYGIRDFDFVDLSGLNLSNKQLKSQPFRFTNLSQTTFINCNLSRCSFIGCDLTGTKFLGCTFIGEDISPINLYARAQFFLNVR